MRLSCLVFRLRLVLLSVALGAVSPPLAARAHSPTPALPHLSLSLSLSLVRPVLDSAGIRRELTEIVRNDYQLKMLDSNRASTMRSGARLGSRSLVRSLSS